MSSALVDLAFTFSPLVEQTSADTVVLDVAGQDLLFGQTVRIAGGDNTTNNLAKEIFRRAQQLNLQVNVSIAANPDAAIHAARSCKGITIVYPCDQLSPLRTLSIKILDYSLAGVDAKRVEEFQQTFALWGVRTFGDLAKLPLPGVAERLGQEGVRLQKLAQGRSDRRLNLVRPPIGFKQSLELEHPITELEPLSFILARLLNQLCANLSEYALATNELRLLLFTEPSVTERGAVAIGSNSDSDPNDHLHERAITLPIPMGDPKTFLRLLLFDVEAQPPSAPIIAVTIVAEPVKSRAAQTGLFIPLTPEPEKLEIILARLAKLVGPENVGSPELLDTHRPDSFRMKRFSLNQRTKRNVKDSSRFALTAGEIAAQQGCSAADAAMPVLPVMGFRIFRPPWHADVKTMHGQPARISARGNSSCRVRGKIVCASGPWRVSGDWWRSDVWARDEWDVAVIDPALQQDEVFCRIYRDLISEQWFVEGVYD